MAVTVDRAGEWGGLAAWWLTEVADDHIFASDVAPLIEELVGPSRATPWLDLGCGEGRVMRLLGEGVIGCDQEDVLLRAARDAGPVVRCRLPRLGWLRDGTLAGAVAVLVAEHVADLPGLLAETRRVVAPGGSLVLVANHPAFTAEGAGPIVDETDGEVLWRWGPYFASAAVPTDVGGATVTFHHRSLGTILTAAADAGWSLERLDERPLSASAAAAYPGYAGQESLPRLVGARWRAGPGRI